MNTIKFLKAICLVLLVLGALRGSAAGQNERGQTATAKNEPSRQPILRIETGMHTAPIYRIGVDAANRFLVTASVDKTVRVWELPSGRLLRTIRVPIGAGFEGKLFAVAISPDGSTIAAGGYTGYEWEKTYSIYLFDRESGRLIRRLGGLPDGVAHLVYSPDGQYLAATLGGKNGVRVFSAVAYGPSGEDKAYGDGSTGADFDRSGRLVTTSYDGFIRIYTTSVNGSLRLVAKTKAKGGQRPDSVKFSPDGTHVAVGFADPSKGVAVLQSSDLAPLFAPDTTGLNRINRNYSLNYVAWSADGGTLYAGGILNDANVTQFIRAWVDGGRGGYRDIAAAAGGGIISHILPLRDGGIIYGAANPAFGVIDASDTRQLLTTVAIANYMGLGQGFLLSPDGTGVGFAYKLLGQSPARFSFADRKLDTAPAGGLNWLPPKTEDSNIRVTELFNTYTPKLNGTPLKFEQHEWSRSLALAPDKSAFLLGTQLYLRLFHRGGAERWKVEGPGDALAVNISSDGKLAGAAFDDGTIRWYRMTDGKELLAFFPHADRKRWVLWTPQGYYDAAPGAEDLIGWHVNNGKEQAADFFPVSRFRSVYYRPDVISRVLTVGDEAEALRLADTEAGRKRQETEVLKRLPPVVSIIAPSEGAEVSSTTVTVRYEARTPSGEPVTAAWALVDGRPVSDVRGQGVKPAAGQSLQVTIPERDCEIAVIAENKFAASVPAVVRLRWRGRTVAEEFVVKPKLYVLAVGVSKYANPNVQQLNFAAKDARDFAAAWQRQKGGLYQDVIVKVLADEQATKDSVLDGFEWILRQTTSKDVAMILLAGHGDNDAYGDYFFCPHGIDPDKTLRTGVPFTEIKKTVERLAGKVVVFVDTCHSGNVFGTMARRGSPDIVGMVNELSSAENGAVVFAASTGRQFSYERAEWNNGAFTKAVLEGVGGGADFKRVGKITVNMLDAFISERVKELTGGKQTPTTTKPKTVPDFPIAVKQ